MKRSDSKHLRRLLASRANGAKSNGPKTAAGKRINALDHGLTAQTLLLPGESSDRLGRLFASFGADLRPQKSLDQFHAKQLAAAAWRIRRAQVVENILVRQTLEQSTPDEALRGHPARAVTPAWVNFRRLPVELRQNELTRLCGEPEAAPATEKNQEFRQKVEEMRNEARPENTTPESEDRTA